jgi:hypothetical protein
MKPTIGSSVFGRRLVILALGAALAVMLGIAATREAAPATVDEPRVHTTVQVPAAQPWTDTNVDIENGDSIRIVATGLVEVDPKTQQRYTPNGAPGCTATAGWVAPGLTCASLIARVDNSNIVEVGSDSTFNISNVLGTGRLYLGLNDKTCCYYDNSGAWHAEIHTY